MSATWMMQKGLQQKHSKSKSASPSGGSSSSTAPSHSADHPAHKPSDCKAVVSITGGWTPMDAKDYLPDVKGVWIKRDNVRHFRWQPGKKDSRRDFRRGGQRHATAKNQARCGLPILLVTHHRRSTYSSDTGGARGRSRTRASVGRYLE